MSDRVLRGLAWASAAALLAGLAAAVVFATYAGKGLQGSGTPVLATAIWGGVGATLAIVRPRNSVGWLLLGIGIALAASLVGGSYVDWSKHRATELPHAAWGAWAGSVEWIVTIGFLIPRLMLVFPTGRIPTRRWRIVTYAQYAVLAGITVSAFKPGPLPDSDYKRYDNPIGIGALAWLDRVPPWLGPVGAVILIVAAFGAAASLIARFRHSHGVERQQLKLLACAVALTALTWILAGLLPAGAVHDAVETISLLGLTITPLTILVAVLRYRLYDIDRLISRTLSYSLLTGLLVAVFAGLVLLTTRVLPFSSPVGVAAATLAAAGLFAPLRSRLQRIVDRRFNRARYDAEALVATFGARLRDAVDPETVLAELAAAARGSLQPAHVSVWVKPA